MNENKKCPICGEEKKVIHASCKQCWEQSEVNGWLEEWEHLVKGSAPSDFPDCEGLQKRLREVENNKKDDPGKAKKKPSDCPVSNSWYWGFLAGYKARAQSIRRGNLN